MFTNGHVWKIFEGMEWGDVTPYTFKFNKDHFFSNKIPGFLTEAMLTLT